MLEINWNPVPHLGVIPVNWYGITMMLGFFVGGYLSWHWAPKFDVPRAKVEGLVLWILVGTVVGARIYERSESAPLLAAGMNPSLCVGFQRGAAALWSRVR